MGQNPEWIVGLQSLGWDAAVKICIAAVLGAIIGLERVWKGHPAGLRTNLLIAISSCIFTIVSIEGFPLQGSAQDTARVAAQIVTGVGFLGAGAVLRSKGHVRGLTTAASIWLVAALRHGRGNWPLFPRHLYHAAVHRFAGLAEAPQPTPGAAGRGTDGRGQRCLRVKCATQCAT